MICVLDTNKDPYFNLAAEEYLFKYFDKPVFRLWRNAPSVIVGCNQNSFAEINREYVAEHNIPVVRRLSGGGAVFHDLGNINFTFIDDQLEGETSAQMFARFTKPILEALKKLGINAYLEGRNDLLIDGRKFSGNAISVHKGRVLQHGTLLFSASIENLSEALNTRPEKFIGKSVKSNISRVTNISSHLPENRKLSVEEFLDFLQTHIGSSLKTYHYSDTDLAAINKLREEKYIKDSWNYGRSPKYTYNNSMKFECGFIEVYLSTEKGIIQDCKIMGDFFSLLPISDIENSLKGLAHKKEVIGSALSTYDLNSYFGLITLSNFLKLF